MEAAGKETKDREAKEKQPEPTPRKGEKSKHAEKEEPTEQRGSASNDQAASAAAGAEAGTATPNMEVEPNMGIANPGDMPLSIEMLSNMQQVMGDKMQELRSELGETRANALQQKKTIEEQAEHIEDLQRITTMNMITARVGEEHWTSTMLDIMGIPKAATHAEKEAFIDHLLDQCGMTLKSCSNIEILDTGGAGTGTEEIWRHHFKDFGRKSVINDCVKSQQRMTEYPWRLLLWSRQNLVDRLRGLGQMDRRTGSSPSRGMLRHRWETLRETMGTQELFSENGFRDRLQPGRGFHEQRWAPEIRFRIR